MTESTLDRLERVLPVVRNGAMTGEAWQAFCDEITRNEAAALIAAARTLPEFVERAVYRLRGHAGVTDRWSCRMCSPGLFGTRESVVHKHDCPVPAAQAALEALK